MSATPAEQIESSSFNETHVDFQKGTPLFTGTTVKDTFFKDGVDIRKSFWEKVIEDQEIDKSEEPKSVVISNNSDKSNKDTHRVSSILSTHSDRIMAKFSATFSKNVRMKNNSIAPNEKETESVGVVFHNDNRDHDDSGISYEAKIKENEVDCRVSGDVRNTQSMKMIQKGMR